LFLLNLKFNNKTGDAVLVGRAILKDFFRGGFAPAFETFGISFIIAAVITPGLF